MTKKTIISTIVALTASFAVAVGPGPRGPVGGSRGPAPRGPAPRGPVVSHAHHHGGPVGRAGFWTGFGLGLAGSLLAPPPPPPPAVPVVVAAPAAVPVVIAAPRQVWVPPVYGERPVFRMGVYQYTERYIITPGYWKTEY